MLARCCVCLNNAYLRNCLSSGCALVFQVLFKKHVSPFVSCSRVQRQTDRQRNKALCDSWAPHRAGRTEYGVTNDDVENVELQSKHVLVLYKRPIQIFAPDCRRDPADRAGLDKALMGEHLD